MEISSKKFRYASRVIFESKYCMLDENENNLCCSDGEWLGSIDVTKQDDWNENSDTVAVARSITGIVRQSGYKIFL